jgi:hypothetical protein
MLSIKDQEYFLGLVEIELARMSDKLSNPSTSADDLVHHTAPAVAKLRLRVASSIAQDKKDAASVSERGIKIHEEVAVSPSEKGREIQEEFSRLARAAFVPAQPEWVCEDELTVTLRRMRSIESEVLVVGTVPNGLSIKHHPQNVTCTLAGNRHGQGDVVTVSESEVIRAAIDAFRRRADEVDAGGDRVDRQCGWSW